MKYGSRKFVINFVSIPVFCLVPVLYRYLGVSDGITLSVLAYISGACALYVGGNLLETKLGKKDEQA